MDCCRRPLSAGLAVALVDLLEFRIDDSGLVLRTGARPCIGSGRLAGFSQAQGRLRQALGRLPDALDIFGLHRVPQGGDRLLEFGLQAGGRVLGVSLRVFSTP